MDGPPSPSNRTISMALPDSVRPVSRIFDSAGLPGGHRYGPQPIAFFSSQHHQAHQQHAAPGLMGYALQLPEPQGPFLPHTHHDRPQQLHDQSYPSSHRHSTGNVVDLRSQEHASVGELGDGFGSSSLGQNTGLGKRKRPTHDDAQAQQGRGTHPGQGVFRASLPRLMTTPAVDVRDDVSPLPATTTTRRVTGETHDMLWFNEDPVASATPTPIIPRSHSPPAHPPLTDPLSPPHLGAWRLRLFHVTPVAIILTPSEYETYFPHIDNVYSHRSTQRYKRARPGAGLVSHYYDCRLKGRPAGTPKSADPNVKKRRRLARERDLCDVKIKMTEYGRGMSREEVEGIVRDSVEGNGGMGGEDEAFPRHDVGDLIRDGFWTMQRVNGNGGQGGGGAGVEGPHRHTLEKSDEIKKNSVLRKAAAQEKEDKKAQRSAIPPETIEVDESGPAHDGAAAFRTTETAAMTARERAMPNDLKLYAASFCPFSQRVWIALEAKGIAYQYCETDPFTKSPELLEANPRGLVPALRHEDWACCESSVILEYLEELDSRVDSGVPLFPSCPRLKASYRLWIEHINRSLVPSFFALLHLPEFATEFDLLAETSAITALQRDIDLLVSAADVTGPFFMGAGLCIVDVHLAPFVVRLSRVLMPKRPRWVAPETGSRWEAWVKALEHHPSVRATTSGQDLYGRTMGELLRGYAGGRSAT